MIFHLHIPSFPLNQFIDSFIYYKDFNPTHSIDRFLPDGNINVVIDLTETPKYIYDNETLQPIQTCRKIWFSGIRNKYISISSGRDCEMFVINFKKGRSYPFVQMPLEELTDMVVDGELVLSNEILNMREEILSLPLVNEKFSFAETFLCKQFGRNFELNPFIDYAVNRIVQSPAKLSIEHLSHKVGYSQKHLIRLFKDHVGLTPKAFLKVERFQRTIQEIESAKSIDWLNLAMDTGYYDHAHFINDFKLFSGLTPQQYLHLKNDQLNYVPVG